MTQSKGLLREWQADEKFPERRRVPSAYNPLYSYKIPRGEERHYAQQYADIYFLRQQKLRKVVIAAAQEEWEDFELGGETVKHVERVLDVRQGELSWIVGTVYVDLPMKPNVLDDVTKDHYISEAPPRQSYYSKGSEPQVMLEDRSGRLRLAGKMLKQNLLVTGAIVAVLGTENANGDFEVLALQNPDLPPQPERWQRDDEEREQEGQMSIDRSPQAGKKIAFVSGLEVSGTDADMLTMNMLAEYLLGEALDEHDQDASTQISRLIIVGNSIAPEVTANQPVGADELGEPLEKRYNYDATSYNPAPTAHLDNFLSELLPSIPVTLMAGEYDPVNYALPQQPLHPALLPRARAYSSTNVVNPEEEEPGWFESVTNPWDGDLEGWYMLGNSGQPVDDILKYVDLGALDGKDDREARLDVMEAMLKWRSSAPTAPDTLWCYPFQDRDPFVLTKCPHVFFVGNQPEYHTGLVAGDSGQSVRLLMIPRFRETGQLVLLDTETLDVTTVQFDVYSPEGK